MTEKQFVETVGKALSEVLSQLKSAKFTYSLLAVPASESSLITLEIAMKGMEKPVLTISFGESFSRMAAGALLGEEVGKNESEEEVSQAVEEFWRQVIGRANTPLTSTFAGGELEVIGIRKPEWRASSSLYVAVGAEGSPVDTLVIGLSRELVALLESKEDFAPKGTEEPSVPTASEKPCDHENLDLLLDVPLAVTLRFGERTLPLREILQLASGAVIELEQGADDPVNLCLEDRVIAQGQVVVVDGCYGLRVLQICRPSTSLLGGTVA